MVKKEITNIFGSFQRNKQNLYVFLFFLSGSQSIFGIKGVL